MTQWPHGALGILVVVAGLCTAHGAAAATRTDAISVSATVVAVCSVTVSASAGTGSARCSQETPYRFVTSVAPAVSGDAKSPSVRTDPQTENARTLVMTFTF